MERMHVIVSGSVQGVGYRAWVKRHARSLSVCGWVKNREDETVEIVAEGDKKQLEELLAMCQTGPDTAAVEQVQTQWGESTGEFADFRVLY